MKLGRGSEAFFHAGRLFVRGGRAAEEEGRVIYVKHVSGLHQSTLDASKPTVYQGGSDVRHMVIGSLEPFLGITALTGTVLVVIRLGGNDGRRIGLDARRTCLTMPGAAMVRRCGLARKRMDQGDGLVGGGPARMGIWRKVRRQKGSALLLVVHGCGLFGSRLRSHQTGKVGVVVAVMTGSDRVLR